MNGELTIEIKGNSKKEIIRKYIGMIKEPLGITRDSHLEILTLLIIRINELRGKFSSKEELRELMSSKGDLKAFAHEYMNGASINSFYQTLSDMRNLGVIDNYNIPKPYTYLAPVLNLNTKYDIKIKLGEVQ